jgi:hypothetical protein
MAAMKEWLGLALSPPILVLLGAIIIVAVQSNGRFSLRTLLLITAIVALVVVAIRFMVVTASV